MASKRKYTEQELEIVGNCPNHKLQILTSVYKIHVKDLQHPLHLLPPYDAEYGTYNYNTVELCTESRGYTGYDCPSRYMAGLVDFLLGRKEQFEQMYDNHRHNTRNRTAYIGNGNKQKMTSLQWILRRYNSIFLTIPLTMFHHTPMAYLEKMQQYLVDIDQSEFSVAERVREVIAYKKGFEAITELL